MKNIIGLIKEAKEKSKKRKFVQTVELAINLSGIDFKKPENNFTEEIYLPRGRGKEAKIAVIGSSLASKAKGIADDSFDDKSITALENDAKKLKKTAHNYDFFIAEAPLMVRIGKSMGKVLGPRGKMPKPLPPHVDPNPMIKRLKNTVKVSVKKNPVVHCAVGIESMSEDELKENLETVLHALEQKLPNKEHNIKSVYLKTTMGCAVRIK